MRLKIMESFLIGIPVWCTGNSFTELLVYRNWSEMSQLRIEKIRGKNKNKTQILLKIVFIT